MNEFELSDLCQLFFKRKLLKQYFIVASDELQHVKCKRFPCIIIQNTSSRIGTERKHWIVHVLFKVNSKINAYTFDSSGGYHKLNIKLKGVVHKNVNKYPIQANKPSNICGLYCVWFTFIRLFNKRKRYSFSSLKCQEMNDRNVTNFYRKLVLFQNRKDFFTRLYPFALRVFNCSCCH